MQPASHTGGEVFRDKTMAALLPGSIRIDLGWHITDNCAASQCDVGLVTMTDVINHVDFDLLSCRARRVCRTYQRTLETSMEMYNRMYPELRVTFPPRNEAGQFEITVSGLLQVRTCGRMTTDEIASFVKNTLNRQIRD